MRSCFAAIAAAPPPAPPPARFAFAVFGGSVRSDRFAFLGFGRAGLFEVVFLFERCGGRLVLRGQRLGGFDRVHLLAAIDHESLRRGQRLIGADGDGDGEALLQPAQMGALRGRSATPVHLDKKARSGRASR